MAVTKKHKVHLHDIPDAERRDAVKAFDAIPMSRRKVRAYFDADIPVSVAERVRTNLRWEVLSAQEQAELRSRDDEFHYENARKLKRILFTLDKDFLDDHRFPLHQSPGVFVLQAKQDDPDDIFQAIHVAAMTLTEAYRKIRGFHLQMKVSMTLEGVTSPLIARYVNHSCRTEACASAAIRPTLRRTTLQKHILCRSDAERGTIGVGGIRNQCSP